MKKHLLSILFLACCCMTIAQPQAGSFSITPKVGMSTSTLTGTGPTLVLCSYSMDYYNGKVQYSEGNFDTEMKCTAKYVTNISFGLEAQRQYTSKIGLTLGCYYTQQGAEFEPGQAPEFTCKEYKTDLKYILVPVLGKFYMCKGLAFEAGLQPGFLISDKTSLDCSFRGASFNNKLYIKDIPYTFEGKEEMYKTGVWGFSGLGKRDFDLSVVLGLSYEIKNLVLGVRYHLSTIPVFKEEVYSSNEGTQKLSNSSFLCSVGYRFELSK